MKWILRNISIYTFSLYLLPKLVQGVQIENGLLTLFVGGIVLTLILFILKPVFSLISFPLNLLTLGLFSTFTNILVLYLLTVFVKDITISSFTFKGLNLAGFIIPKVTFSLFFAYVISAFVLSLISSFITWLME